MDFSALLQAVPAVAKGIGGFIASQQDYPEPQGLQEALQAIANSQAWSAAALNPDHPYFRGVEEAEAQKGRLSLIDAVRMIQRQNNLSAAKGAAPVSINPNRRDETVWKTLARGFMENKINARNQARDFLLKAANAQTGVANAYRYPMAVSDKVNQFNRVSSMGGQQGLFDVLGQVGKVFQGSQQAEPSMWERFRDTPVNYAPPDSFWG